MTMMVNLSGVGKVFGSTKVLHDVGFQVEKGEMISLLGPSGCGKSTTLRCIAGLEDIDAGEIRIEDRLISSPGTTVAPEQRNLGVVFQNYAIWPHMTVHQNIAFGLEVKKMGRAGIAARVEEVLQLVGLSGLEGRYPSELSGGQQQRVAIARSVATSPTVLLFDEPLSNLDARLREHMRSEIRAIQQKVGLTAIYVTHDQVEAMTMSDRILVMREGRIVEAGAPRHLFDNPATEFGARFLGNANVWPGQVERVGDGLTTLRLANGLSLMTMAAPEAGDANLLVMVRPGSVRVHTDEPPPADGSGSVRWEARIVKSNFLGDMREFVCEVEGLTVLASTCGEVGPILEPGTRCWIEIAADRVRLVSGEAAGNTQPTMRKAK